MVFALPDVLFYTTKYGMFYVPTHHYVLVLKKKYEWLYGAY